MRKKRRMNKKKGKEKKGMGRENGRRKRDKCRL